MKSSKWSTRRCPIKKFKVPTGAVIIGTRYSEHYLFMVVSIQVSVPVTLYSIGGLGHVPDYIGVSTKGDEKAYGTCSAAVNVRCYACHRIHDMSETPHMPVVDYIGPRNSQHAIAIIYEILSSGSMDKPLYV